MSVQDPQTAADLIGLKQALIDSTPALIAQIGEKAEFQIQPVLDSLIAEQNGKIAAALPFTPGGLPAPVVAFGRLYVDYLDSAGNRVYGELPAAIDAGTIPLAPGNPVSPPSPPVVVTVPVLPPGVTTPPDDGGTTPAMPPAPTDGGTPPSIGTGTGTGTDTPPDVTPPTDVTPPPDVTPPVDGTPPMPPPDVTPPVDGTPPTDMPPAVDPVTGLPVGQPVPVPVPVPDPNAPPA